MHSKTLLALGDSSDPERGGGGMHSKTLVALGDSKAAIQAGVLALHTCVSLFSPAGRVLAQQLSCMLMLLSNTLCL